MRAIVYGLVTIGGLASGAAFGAELQPFQASSIALGDVSGVAYYTAENDGYRVVATVAAGESATPVRFITTLLPGQKTVLSVPREAGRGAIALEIARVGDRVHVTDGDKLTRAGD